MRGFLGSDGIGRRILACPLLLACLAHSGLAQARSSAQLRAPAILDSARYDFTPQKSVVPLHAGANHVTLSPVPLGVNWNDGANNHYLWIGDGPWSEACYIISSGPGTAVAGSPSGSLTIQCDRAHAQGYTVGPVANGIQEAICSLPASGGEVIVRKDIASHGVSTACGKEEVAIRRLAGLKSVETLTTQKNDWLTAKDPDLFTPDHGFGSSPTVISVDASYDSKSTEIGHAFKGQVRVAGDAPGRGAAAAVVGDTRVDGVEAVDLKAAPTKKPHEAYGLLGILDVESHSTRVYGAALMAIIRGNAISDPGNGPALAGASISSEGFFPAPAGVEVLASCPYGKEEKDASYCYTDGRFQENSFNTGIRVWDARRWAYWGRVDPGGIGMELDGMNTPGVDTWHGIFLNRPVDAVGDATDIVFGDGSQMAHAMGAIKMIDSAPGEAALTINAQTAAADGKDNEVMRVAGNGMVTLTGVPYAKLGTPPDGTFTWCKDCNATCSAAGGPGKFCKREGGAWSAM